MFKNMIILSAVATFVIPGITESFAAPIFSGTSNSSQWEVATNVGEVDGQFSSFPTSGFVTATPIANRPEWIANNATGTNGSIGTWTFFVFRQSFDMTGYDPTTAHLQFQWAADDSGQGFAARGSWKPKFSLNSSPLVTGVWPNDNSYGYGSTVDLSSGFVPGLNTLAFYVEGNGVTDGFALRTIGFTANPVPIPAAVWLFSSALTGLAFLGKHRVDRKSRSATGYVPRRNVVGIVAIRALHRNSYILGGLNDPSRTRASTPVCGRPAPGRAERSG